MRGGRDRGAKAALTSPGPSLPHRPWGPTRDRAAGEPRLGPAAAARTGSPRPLEPMPAAPEPIPAAMESEKHLRNAFRYFDTPFRLP